ncbi:MAG TPA: hypothetical protein DD381_00430 [Lentisphaeria bacterium]|nr:MAG: hypothetical protein A2X47_05105 [Lentisphaerae bacterium GWF2_38_69]HBM14808.1 hypothetical protein [Lentisphaeria bacterium]
MDIVKKEIPKQFLDSIPNGIKLIKKGMDTFLVVENLFCPNGHRLMSETIQIHGMPAIKFKISDGFSNGFLFLDAFWGSHAKLYSFIPKHSESLESFDVCCPVCSTSLIVKDRCHEDGCDCTKAVQMNLPGKNRIIACARLGCPGHRIEIKEMPQGISETLSEINFYVESFDDTSDFRGV